MSCPHARATSRETLQFYRSICEIILKIHLIWGEEIKVKVYKNQRLCIGVYTDSFTLMISFVFSSWIINNSQIIFMNRMASAVHGSWFHDAILRSLMSAMWSVLDPLSYTIPWRECSRSKSVRTSADVL